jgi:hypothetical protein
LSGRTTLADRVADRAIVARALYVGTAVTAAFCRTTGGAAIAVLVGTAGLVVRYASATPVAL